MSNTKNCSRFLEKKKKRYLRSSGMDRVFLEEIRFKLAQRHGTTYLNILIMLALEAFQSFMGRERERERE